MGPKSKKKFTFKERLIALGYFILSLKKREDMTLDSQSCQKHINDVFHIVMLSSSV